MAPKAPSSAPEGGEKKNENLSLTDKAGGFVEQGFDKLESFGISREMALDFFESFLGDDKTGFLARILLPIYEKERAKDLKKSFDKILGEDKYELTDKEIVTIHESWKKSNDFKTKTFEEYLTHLKTEGEANGKKASEPWNIKNIDVSGEIQTEQLKKLRKEVNNDMDLMHANFDDLIEGAVTGEYQAEAVKEAAEKAVAKQKDITEQQKKSLMDTIIGDKVGKELTKLACISSLQIKMGGEISVPNESILKVRELGELNSSLLFEQKGNVWTVKYKRITANLKDTPEFFASKLSRIKKGDKNKENINLIIGASEQLEDNKDSKMVIKKIREEFNLETEIVVDSEKKSVTDTEGNSIKTGNQDADSDTESTATPETSQKTTPNTRKGRRDAAKSSPDTNLGPAA